MKTEQDIYAIAEELLKNRPPQDTKPVPEKTITVTPDERRRLEQMFGKNISTGADLIRAVEKCVSVSTGGVTIELSPYLLDRLKSRCISMSFEAFMVRTVRQQLEAYAGLR